MQCRRNKCKVLTVIAVSIFLISMFYAGSVATLPTEATTSPYSFTWSQKDVPYGPSWPDGENGTFVGWNKDSNSSSDTWSWENKQWLFGPRPDYKIYHENGSLFEPDDYASFDEWLTFAATVPMDIFSGNATLQSVQFSGWYMTPDYNFSADFNLNFNLWNGSVTWDAYSSENNRSVSEPQPPSPAFVEIDSSASSYSHDAMNYYVNFVARFTSDAPIGLYSLDMFVMDTEYNSYGMQGYDTGWQFRGISVEVPPSEAMAISFGGSYTLQKLSLTGESIYSVSRNGDFIMRFNLTGPNPEIVRLSFQLPSDVRTLANVTSNYIAPVNHTGGWEYDDALDTYVWNDTLQITTYEWIYGTHEEYQWTPLNTGRAFNITRLNYENHTVYNKTQWLPAMLIYTYNVSDGSWSEDFGYFAFGYPYDHYVEGVYEKEYLITEPYPSNLPVFYELNLSRCQASMIDKQLVVDFVGHFTDAMSPTTQGDSVHARSDVYGTDGNPWQPAVWGDHPLQTQSEFEMAQQIAIESPVTIAWLLTADGRNPMGWTFQVDKGQYFQAKAELQGGSDIADDIDAASLELNAFTGTWSENESITTSLYYEISYAMNGTPTLTAYNYTMKNNLTYTTFWDYTLRNKTGWHKEYNATTGTTEYVYGDYEVWEYGPVEGWTWTDWYYNQRTGEWQMQWLAPRGPDTLITTPFCTTENFTKWVEDGNLYVSFAVNMSESVADTTYWWDFSFMNNTWHEDLDSEWGLHPVYDWTVDSVYSFDYQNTTKVYVEKVVDSQLAYHVWNGTLAGQNLLGLQSPYIVIGDEKVPVDQMELYDPMMSETTTRMFFYDHYDSTEHKDYYYYELTNGTRIPVTYNEGFWIYNVSLKTGEWFLTGQEMDKFWEGNGTDQHYWIDIHGGLHQGSDMYYAVHNVNVTPYDFIDVSDWTQHQYVRYGDDGLLNITEHWWDSAAKTYFIADTNGTMYKELYDNVTENYMIYIDGAWQYVSWPEVYYIEPYGGDSVILATWSTARFWYYQDSHDVIHEMPYPGAAAVDEWNLNHIKLDGGKVPSTKSLLYNGTAYPVHKLNETFFYANIEGQPYELDEFYIPVIIANGTVSWGPTQIGESARVGTYTADMAFHPIEYVDYYSHEWNDTLKCEIYHLMNGTDWQANKTRITGVYLLDFEGKQFYSWFDIPDSRKEGNETVYFYWALNNSMIDIGSYSMWLPVINSTVVEVHSNSSMNYIVFKNKEYKLQENVGPILPTKILNGTSEVFFGGMSNPVYEFSYREENVTARVRLEAIRRLSYVWGYAYVYGPQPIDSTVYKNFDTIVIGIPEWGMWDFKNWAVDPVTGALDLDGDFDTTSDQYYVLEEYSSTDSWTHTWDHMDVWLDWDPNGTAYGDEIHVNSWMGLDTFTWNYSWNDTFYWYNAENFTKVTAAEMQDIKDTMMFPDGTPRAGYWGVAWMAQNMTWQDILAEAEANGWDWFDQDGQTWTWLSFGIDQNYGTSAQEGDVDHWLSIGLHYEYSGLMLWKDSNGDGVMDVDVTSTSSNELTHYLIPDSVDDVSFVTPGEAYGDYNASGWLHLNLTSEVTWGVSFHDINGTVFPFSEFGYWDWYDGVVTGTDMRTFDERPSKVSIDELSFLVHFQGTLSTEGINNEARIKVDNYVGNWDVDMLGGRRNLANRSLALNYFSEVRMADFAFKANGSFADSESTVSSDTFELETQGAKFAEMIMGGVTYDWGKNMSAPYDVLSYTTPLGAFRTAYESDSGQSATAWSFSSSMYMVSIGFPEWDGYSVDQDPVFVSYVSASGVQNAPGAVTFGTFSIDPAVPSSSDSVTVSGDIYTTEQINDVSLYYSTDQFSWNTNQMFNDVGTTWSGTIPPYPENTQVYFKVVVTTSTGTYESNIYSYVVGQGMVTTTTTVTYVPGGPGLSPDVMIMIGGIAVVVVILVLVVVRRKR